MQQESFVELLEQLADNSADLIRNEIALTKQEIRDELKSFRSGLLTVAVGTIISMSSLLTLIGALVIHLTSYLTPGVAAFVTGIILAVSGGVVTMSGFRQMKRMLHQ